MEHVEEYLKEKWQQLTAFSSKTDLKERLWQEVVYRYTEAHRYYHNLNHIGYIFSLCDKYISEVKNPAVVGFAILYHDIVYDIFRKDNEEQSAAMAENHLHQLKLNKLLISQVKEFIEATKLHLVPDYVAGKNDLALFLDLDMAILAEEHGIYAIYSQKIRQEYGKYSNDVYSEGRKLALSKMLDTTLYHTTFFKDNFEEKAKQNMRNEILMLSK